MAIGHYEHPDKHRDRAVGDKPDRRPLASFDTTARLAETAVAVPRWSTRPRSAADALFVREPANAPGDDLRCEEVDPAISRGRRDKLLG